MYTEKVAQTYVRHEDQWFLLAPVIEVHQCRATMAYFLKL